MQAALTCRDAPIRHANSEIVARKVDPPVEIKVPIRAVIHSVAAHQNMAQ
jgi:hypothetical protein